MDTSVLSTFIPPGAAASVVIYMEIFFCLHLSSCLGYKHTSTHSLCTQLCVRHYVNGFNLHGVFVSQLSEADIQALFKQAHRHWMRTCCKVILTKSLK